MRECVIESRSLTKKFGDVVALKDVDITIKRGDIYGLIGDNGAGKTTFLKILTGQIYPSGGEIRLFDAYAERELEKNRKRTGAIIETPGFYPKLSVEKNLEYYRIQKGIPGKEKVEAVLKTVGLWEKRKRKAGTLSLGMKQRLGLGIALLGEPELLILDEPINGLDPSGIIEMRNLLLRLNHEKNITIIISSHILSELEQIATIYGFLSQGWLLKEITAEELHEQCAVYLDIAVTQPEHFAALLEKRWKDIQYQVLPDSTIRIKNPEMAPDAYSTLASENGIGVLRLAQKQMMLEEYYMNLKEKGRLSC
ncbi:MAG: ATP-binding cassette domain-containing protein [Faecalicatena sp.]|uniref:ABC transporter ATP-binding protein n=1 Tax=Faecalicatena sp. TaxID=2005360 RepID=UPI0025888425|nr:ATP-binding cassette domain-containing protein [Faecalicatena sp.]MCI6465786.1 ATP-binding cassette domain-containing protein [Faecalicatena sp.]MDY5618798.1 ATP-binding cassette domain-containing protein [Lachnospiraceae bacterium]